MHLGLKSAAWFAAILFAGHAGFTQYYETGFNRYLAPVFFLTVSAVFLAFAKHRPWTWRPVLYWAIVVIVINAAFFPSEEHFREHLQVARILIGLEVAISVVLLVFMLSPGTKERFFAASAS
jgi:hypothetical protein